MLPEEKNASPASEQKITQQLPDSGVLSEHVALRMMQIGSGQSYTPTSEQVDKILSLQEKGMDYTHSERIQFLPSQIFRFISFIVIVLVVVGLFVFTTLYAKEYLGEISAGLFGLIAGGIGGYGYGTRKSKKNDD